MNFIERFRAWSKRKTAWTTEMQLEHLRRLVRADHRWLAADKTANELTTRYLNALDPHWYTLQHEDVCALRRRIGLEPNYSRNSPPDAAEIFNMAARFAACLWDFHETCPECGNNKKQHLPACDQTYTKEFKGPQDTTRVFSLAFGIKPDNV